MKPVLMIAVIFGAVIAGAAGGYVASQVAAPAQSTPTPRAAVADAHTDDSKEDLKPAVSKHGDEIVSLRKQIDDMMGRLGAAEKDAAEAASLKAQVADLNKKLDAAEKKMATGAPAGGGGGAVIDADSPSFKEAVNKAIAEKDAADKAARDAEREKQMADFVANANKQMVDTLTDKLALTSDQIPKIKAVIEDMSTKRRDVFTKAGEARQKGEQFDWGTEMGAINTAATEAVKAELTSAQQSTFAELTGERGLSALERGMGGMGGRGPGGTGGQGGGRGGRGGNGN